MFVDNTVYINFVLIVTDFVKAFCYTQIAAIAVWFDNRRNTSRQKFQMVRIILNNAVIYNLMELANKEQLFRSAVPLSLTCVLGLSCVAGEGSSAGRGNQFQTLVLLCFG